jgi:hypothetical protein
MIRSRREENELSGGGNQGLKILSWSIRPISCTITYAKCTKSRLHALAEKSTFHALAIADRSTLHALAVADRSTLRALGNSKKSTGIVTARYRRNPDFFFSSNSIASGNI